MLEYLIAGLALGSIYAICATGLIATYVSAGVFNFAFAPIAYFLARLFYELNTEKGLSTPSALFATVLVAAPVLGAVLYGVLFRSLAQASTLIKVVVTIGLSVTLPAAARMIFGQMPIGQVPGLAPRPVAVYSLGGVNVSLDQIFVFVALVLLVGIGGLILRFTTVGLKVRAAVDSAALSSLCGTSPQRVQLAVWMVTTAMAGLAGILVAPSIGMISDQFVVVMNAAIAAVIAARLTRIGVGIVAALVMGVITGIVQWALPPSSSFTAAVLPSVPFMLILVVLIYHMARGHQADEAAGVGGALDRAIRPAGEPVASGPGSMRDITERARRRSRSSLVSPGAIVLVVFVALLPVMLLDFWVGLVAQGIAMGVVFLSITVATGQGGMIWLYHATLAGLGGLFYAQFTTNAGYGPGLALLLSALVSTVVATVVTALTSRLGTLYVALVTLSVGLLIERLVFATERFSQAGAGVAVVRPALIETDRAFGYVALVLFCVLGLAAFNLRRTTAGMMLAATRSSGPGARALGIDILRMKVLAAGLAGFTAGIGGALMVMYSYSSAPTAFSTVAGLVWLAVVVSIGVRTASAALVAGLIFSVVPGIFATYLPTSLGELPSVLFGVGAIMVVRNPDGVVAMHAAQLEWLIGKILRRASARPEQAAGALR